MTEKTGVWEPLRDHSPQVHWMRVENLVGTGMSDVNGCLNGVEAWIENKLVKGNQITFQPMQPAWIIQRIAHGGRVFVLARKGDALLVWAGPPLLTLLRACQPRGKALVVDYRASVPLLTMPPPYDWDLLVETFFSRPVHSFAVTAKAA